MTLLSLSYPLKEELVSSCILEGQLPQRKCLNSCVGELSLSDSSNIILNDYRAQITKSTWYPRWEDIVSILEIEDMMQTLPDTTDQSEALNQAIPLGASTVDQDAGVLETFVKDDQGTDALIAKAISEMSMVLAGSDVSVPDAVSSVKGYTNFKFSFVCLFESY